MKHLKFGILLLVCLCCLFGCQSKAKSGGEEMRLSLSETAIELAVGESEELTLSVQPSDAIDKNVEWKSSDESVAVVDGGMVTAKGAGEAEITASAGDKQVRCVVTVRETRE